MRVNFCQGKSQRTGIPAPRGEVDECALRTIRTIGLTQNTFAPPELYGILEFYQTTAIRIVGAINSCFI